MPVKKDTIKSIFSEKTIFPLGVTDEDIFSVILKLNPAANSELVKVISIKIKPIDSAKSFGLSGDYFIADIQYQVEDDVEKHDTVFIKSKSLNYPIERNRVKNLKLFEREKAFYVTLDASREQNNLRFNYCPQLLKSNENFIVLEDLSLAGYESVAKMILTKDQIKSCLGCIAQMHAQNITLRGQDGLKSKPVNILFEDDLFQPCDPWVLSGISAIQTLGLKDSRNQRVESQDFIQDDLTGIVLDNLDQSKAPNDFFKVLCHCDLRPKNIFLRSDSLNGTEFLFTDYQQVRYLPPAVDILLFLYYNLRKPFPSDELLTEYLNFYYEQLNIACSKLEIDLEKYLSYESFQISIDYYKVFALILRALQVPFLCDPNYAIRERNDDILKYINCISIDRSGLINTLCEKDSSLELFIFESNQAVIESLAIE